MGPQWEQTKSNARNVNKSHQTEGEAHEPAKGKVKLWAISSTQKPTRTAHTSNTTSQQDTKSQTCTTIKCPPTPPYMLR
jgi:hypothetical protein